MFLRKRLTSVGTAVVLTMSASVPMLTADILSISAAENHYYFNDNFESDTNGWTGRGEAAAEKNQLAAYEGRASLYCSGRTASWNGVSKELDSTVFKAGETYSFSVNAMYERGASTEEFKLTLQYTTPESTTAYGEIATAKVSSGQWVQLTNKAYTIPEDASNLIIYVETIDTETSFYIDEAVAAPSGTEISGAKPLVVSPGDVDCDGTIDVFDMILMRQALTKGLDNKFYEKSADVDKNGTIEIADAVQLEQYLLGKISEFTFNEPPKPDNKWDDYTETATSQWIDFYESSIYSMGNTYRLTKKLEAAENGEKLTMAYLGGSITEGKKYSTPFSNYVKSTFATGGFTEVNAGLSGTSSVVGLVRSESNIVEKNPDIVFIEFSVNDHEDIMYKKCFESVIKKFLDLPNEPAVVILINRAQGGFSSQKQMIPVGENFDIPIISMDNALTKAFNSGFLGKGDYFSDEYHPHDNGGQLIADCLGYFFRKAMKTENRSESYTVPTSTVYGTEYQTCKNVDPKTLTNFNAGSWTAGSGYGGSALPYSYNLNGGSPMTFTASGKGFIVVFKANSSGMGSIDVTVNGKTTKISGNKQYCWGGPDAELGYYQETSGELNVSISGSGSFTIWGFGLIE
ncbi:MAG: carbohydrate binding domain-containing protein [Ruminococcus sp.]|nr:carbohydrate binding domain-containing protein [Ruminococcus sp.]